jgi:exodeoxyribonuclease III
MDLGVRGAGSAGRPGAGLKQGRGNERVRIATWNVNSIRARLARVTDWLGRSEIDVLAMQETKIGDDAFPHASFEERGYQVATFGLNQWNGVAVASRVGLEDVIRGVPGLPAYGDPPVTEARSLGAMCGGVRVWSLYVPNGRAIGDPHYFYKLDWLKALRNHIGEQLAADPSAQLIFCGDFNIAPTDGDIWSVEYYTGQTHVTPPERQAFQDLLDAGLTDVVRPHAPGPGTYTYWDYTQLSFPKRRGMRIDFLLGSDSVAERVTGALIDREERKGKSPSDHAPVIVELSNE